MIEYIIYAKEQCDFCQMAGALLQEKGKKYKFVLFDEHEAVLAEIKNAYGHFTVPIIFRKSEFGYELVGGYTDLQKGLDT